MFEWNTYWRRQREKPEAEPKGVAGSLKVLAKSLSGIWPKRDNDMSVFPALLRLIIITLVFFGFWFLTEWLFPVNLLISIPAAVVLTRIAVVVWDKMSAENHH